MKRGILMPAMIAFACAALGAGAQAPTEWTEVGATQMDVRAVTPLAEATLQSPSFKWRNAQTEHFVVHYENGIFAAKVARMAEFFYSYIAEDMKGARDKSEGRSHIFIFRSKKDWDIFMTSLHGRGMEWSFSMVEGTAMFLQQAEDTSSSAEILGHEMTHLVVNRFLTGNIPVWLNEGIAEWYGEFAYAVFKGIKKSKRTQFRDLPKPYPVGELLTATGYPADSNLIPQFYKTSKYIVAYLKLEKPADAFVPFVTQIMNGTDVHAALTEQYGIADAAQLERELKQFAN